MKHIRLGGALACAILVGHSHAQVEETAAALTDAARALADGTDSASLTHDFESGDRRRFNYFPLPASGETNGLTLKQMEIGQRRALHRALQAGLSDTGYLRVLSIQALDAELRRLNPSDETRNPEHYVTRVFGEPSESEPWTIQFEGHHVSLNFTVAGDAVRATPVFLGSNPDEIRSGPRAGVRVLGPQREMAYALLESLTPEQRRKVVHDGGTKAVSPGVLEAPSEAQGLAASEMTEAQRGRLRALIAVYADTLAPALAEEELRRMDDAGFGRVRFAWFGSTERGRASQYRVQGPTLLIALDAIEDQRGQGANHVHTLWRDPERDFGADLLRQHYQQDHR